MEEKLEELSCSRKKKTKGNEELGPPIGDLTLPPRSSASSVGTGDHGGGVEVADWRPQSPNQLETPTWNSSSICRLGPSIGGPNPSTEVTSVLCGYRRPR
ncbi:hypothetical protein CRG98_001258 [Punica granatum]|uniref:Uncharacterized protein n=1 Tax=Punica granatum TaxID=22663 RepID=A0A2I0LCA7_PUNGR|nr:hypothetical protein CRG98_001258 [Punica granatum]